MTTRPVDKFAYGVCLFLRTVSYAAGLGSALLFVRDVLQRKRYVGVFACTGCGGVPAEGGEAEGSV